MRGFGPLIFGTPKPRAFSQRRAVYRFLPKAHISIESESSIMKAIENASHPKQLAAPA